MSEQQPNILSKILCLLMMLPFTLQASPQVLRIDGSIFNASGVPITGSRDIQVKAYDASTGGSAVWTSSVYNTSVTSGRFAVALDATVDTVALTDRLAAKAANGEIWFEIVYDTGAANGAMDTPVTMGTRIRGKGAMFALVAAKADVLTGVTTTVAEMNRLAGVTASVQSQIDSAFSAIASAPSATGRIARTGDTMSGSLGLAGSGTTPDRVAYLNANRELVTSSVVSSAELDFLGGVTSNVGSKVNLFTNTEAGYLSGVTTNIGSKLNRFTTAEAGYISGVTSGIQPQISTRPSRRCRVSRALRRSPRA